MVNKNKLISILDICDNLRKEGVVTTKNGLSYDIMNLDLSSINIDFISGALSKIARYNGHNKDNVIYSVAQHSVMMSEAILLCYGDVQLAKQALLHDASEAYTGDVVKPLKELIKNIFDEIEKGIERQIAIKFNLDYPMSPIIKEVDVNICAYEMSTWLTVHHENWDIWDIEKSKRMFLNMFERLDLLETIENKKWKNGKQ